MANLEKFKIIRDIEQGMFDNRPCFKTVLDGAWVWRFADGFTGRANSLQCLDSEDDRDLKRGWNVIGNVLKSMELNQYFG